MEMVMPLTLSFFSALGMVRQASLLHKSLPVRGGEAVSKADQANEMC